jgi:glycosyltransferase involved in cell wall biosynthesis
MVNMRPVIITRSGGAAEIVEHEDDGIVIEKEDIAAMAAAMLKYASDSLFYKKVQLRGRMRIETCFDITTTASRFLGVLKEIAGGTDK